LSCIFTWLLHSQWFITNWFGFWGLPNLLKFVSNLIWGKFFPKVLKSRLVLSFVFKVISSVHRAPICLYSTKSPINRFLNIIPSVSGTLHEEENLCRSFFHLIVLNGPQQTSHNWKCFLFHNVKEVKLLKTFFFFLKMQLAVIVPIKNWTNKIFFWIEKKPIFARNFTDKNIHSALLP